LQPLFQNKFNTKTSQKRITIAKEGNGIGEGGGGGWSEWWLVVQFWGRAANYRRETRF